MNIHEKIEVGVRSAAEKMVQIRFRQIANEKFNSQKEIDRIINDAAEYIRSEILKDATAKLNGRSEKVLNSSRTVVHQIPKKKTAAPVAVAPTKQISDEKLLVRIRAILQGAEEQGSTITSLYQRISNHRDVIGTGLTVARISKLVSKAPFARRTASGHIFWNGE